MNDRKHLYLFESNEEYVCKLYFFLSKFGYGYVWSLVEIYIKGYKFDYIQIGRILDGKYHVRAMDIDRFIVGLTRIHENI